MNVILIIECKKKGLNMIIEKIDIWQGFDFDNEVRPKLTTYMRMDRKRGMVLIFPGGGYRRTSPREAEAIALRYINAGYNAAFLDYSVEPNKYPAALYDALRSLTVINDNKDEWLVDMDNLFICGFSAGGHLAASVSNLYLSDIELREGIEVNYKIKGCILSYPVITSGKYRHEGSFNNLAGDNQEMRDYLSMENRVNELTPTTFLWHTFDDVSVPVENSLLYSKALADHKIPFEMHIYPKGVHGLSLATEETAERPDHINPHTSGWMDLSIKWMKQV